MRFLFFKLLVFFLTLLRAVFPSLNEKTISYDRLPVRFSVERQSEIFAPAGETVCEYPTILRLAHQKNEADNGTLLVSFEQWDSTYPVFSSTDDGRTWQKLCHVTDDYNNYYCEWMPFLYELPADIGDFEKGTVILAATSITGAGVTDSTITLYESTDLGRTFRAFCNVDKAGGTDWGVWEPYLIYEEETGRLFCFYADDSDPAHSQKLVYKYSTDLIHWSEKLECVACADPELRPGMASVVKLGNGEYYMVYEMGGIGSYTIYCKRSTSLDDWGDVADYGTVVSAAGKTLWLLTLRGLVPGGRQMRHPDRDGEPHGEGPHQHGVGLVFELRLRKDLRPGGQSAALHAGGRARPLRLQPVAVRHGGRRGRVLRQQSPRRGIELQHRHGEDPSV
ncbi:MAG: exo-alpha-sialidase [Clostridia bacterium]|nr:exo-alpha-sialidase [Clostridia bacterium]